jgi:signal transduction histidine kinase
MMKLQTRLTLLVSILVIAVSGAIGYFAIQTITNLQIEQLDSRLESAIGELSNSEDDPLSFSILLADQSDLKFSVGYVSTDLSLTTIFESDGDLENVPSPSELRASLDGPQNINQGDGLRIRSLSLPDNEYLILSFSRAEITASANTIIKNILLFTFVVTLLGVLLSYFSFRRDSQINALVGVLKSSKERMQTFLGDASHELRTPLSVIKGYFEILTKRSDISHEDRSKYFDRINTEVVRMEEIISDLLLITELDQGIDTALSRTNISKIIQDNIQDLKALEPRRLISASIQEDVNLEITEGYARQLFANLFSNIKRHTPPDSSVTIHLDARAAKVRFMLEDSGPGLPTQTYIDGINAFQRFDKSRSRQSGGSGLGMTIMRKIVEYHGGEISLSPSSTGGLRTEITF